MHEKEIGLPVRFAVVVWNRFEYEPFDGRSKIIVSEEVQQSFRTLTSWKTSSGGKSCEEESLLCRSVKCPAYETVHGHGGLLDILGY